MTINIDFKVKQRVYISELKIWGKVIAIFINSNITYNVRYFDGKDPKECYFHADELSLQETETTLGFKS